MVQKILKEKKGSSMIFVSCVMLLLMSICISVLVAASVSSGAAANRISHDRLVICADSIHKNVMYSLQNDDDPDNRLRGQLFTAFYDAYETNKLSGTESVDIDFDIDADVTFDGQSPAEFGLEIKTLKFHFPAEKQHVVNFHGVDKISAPDGTVIAEAIPETTEVSATLFVTSEVTSGKKILTTVAAYELTGGRLLNRVTANTGKWRLIAYENKDDVN